jgi:dTDP-4-amino-4,6-dideoxygalactose transaminase
MNLPSDQEISGRSFDEAELRLLSDVLQSGTLTSTKGKAVKQLEKRFAEEMAVKHAFAVTSGTAAVHTALAAINPNPGDEIITTSITDMGALAPILYQGAIPVFADVDSHTYNVTADSITVRLSDRTRAIIATHLFGNPCEMGAIMELADRKNIPVIEDAAQAFSASHNGKKVGTFGAVGCFSFQQGKHITCGEGGIVVTDRDDLARRMFLFINKAWGYGDPKPDHYFLALNYRMSELQGAVALAQLEKLDALIKARRKQVEKLTKRLSALNGIVTPQIHPTNIHTYWRYCLRVDPDIVADGAVGLSRILKEYGIHTLPRYIQNPAFMCEIFRDQKTFGNSRYPFDLARPEATDYNPVKYPGTFDALDKILVIPWNERYTDDHVAYIADSIQDALEKLSKAAP